MELFIAIIAGQTLVHSIDFDGTVSEARKRGEDYIASHGIKGARVVVYRAGGSCEL